MSHSSAQYQRLQKSEDNFEMMLNQLENSVTGGAPIDDLKGTLRQTFGGMETLMLAALSNIPANQADSNSDDQNSDDWTLSQRRKNLETSSHESLTLYERGEKDTDGDEAVPEGETADENLVFQREVVSRLSRMYRRLKIFLQQLKDLASKAWHTVCEAWSAIVNFFKRIFCRCSLPETGQSATYSKLHVA